MIHPGVTGLECETSVAIFMIDRSEIGKRQNHSLVWLRDYSIHTEPHMGSQHTHRTAYGVTAYTQNRILTKVGTGCASEGRYNNDRSVQGKMLNMVTHAHIIFAVRYLFLF